MTPTIRAPYPPSDGQEWEGLCARCGGSLSWAECECCGGIGEIDYYDDYDGLPWAELCSMCMGTGGWWACGNTTSWCDSHPRTPGAPERGVIEWFVVPRAGGVE